MATDRPGRRRGLTTGRAGEARTAGARQIAGNVGLQYAGRVFGLLVSLVTLPLIARTLGTSGFGVYSSALAYVGIFASISEFGLTSAATMRMAGEPEHERQWLGALSSLRTAVSSVTVLLCAAATPLVFQTSEQRVAALLLSVTIGFSGAGALMSVFFARLRGMVPLAISVFESCFWMVLVLSLAALGAGPVLVAGAYVLLRGSVALAQVLVTRGMADTLWRNALRWWRPLLQIAVPTGLAYVFLTISFSLDQVLLLRLAGEQEAGVYGAAYRFLTPLLFLPQAVMGAIFPVMSATGRDDLPRLTRIIQRSADYLAVVTLPVAAVFLVLSGPLVALVLGGSFERSASVLPILMLAYAPIGYGTLAGFLAPVIGLQWRLTLYAAIGAAANVALNFLLVPRYGAVGSAWATVGTESLSMGLMLATCLRRLQIRLEVRRMAGATAAAGAMAGAMLLLRPVGLLPALVAGGVTFAAALIGLRVVVPQELRALFAR